MSADPTGGRHPRASVHLARRSSSPTTMRARSPRYWSTARLTPSTPRGAVLHVHGFCDYFFQVGTAEFFTALGYDFYALDLRKYGRSLQGHQTPNFCLDLAEYYPELDAAMEIIRERDGHEVVVVSGHSTGGSDRAAVGRRPVRRGQRVADAFVLNSPWLDLQGSFFIRTAGTEAINRLGQRRPYAVDAAQRQRRVCRDSARATCAASGPTT